MIYNISIDNLDNCMRMLEPDMIDNLGREHFHGLYAENEEGECAGALVWEHKGTKKPGKSTSEIGYFKASDALSAGELLRAYDEAASHVRISRSCFESTSPDFGYRSVFSSEGFQMKETESRDVHLSLEDLSSLKYGKKIPGYVVPIGELAMSEFKDGISNCISSGNTGLLEDVAMLPPTWYDLALSCAVRTDGRITGLFLIHHTSGGTYFPQLLSASGADSQRDLLHMLSFSIKEALKTCPDDARVLVRRHDDKSRAFVSYLFPNKKGDTVIAGVRKEPFRG